MDIKAVALMIILKGMIAVYRKHGEDGDKLEALTENVGDRNIISVIVIRIKCENTSCKSVFQG